MKLEAKHIAKYLPFDLMVNLQGRKGKLLGIYGSLAVVKLEYTIEASYDIEVIQPMLRPIKDLETYDLLRANYLKSKGNTIDMLPYHEIKWLIENHFDIDDLINQGLAVPF